jgi:hypothetical protein
MLSMIELLREMRMTQVEYLNGVYIVSSLPDILW